MKKIILMSELFGVSTDYLLRDDIETASEPEVKPVDNGLEETVRSVSMEEANAFLDHNEKAAVTVSTGVMMCILSPVILILMAGLAETGSISLSEEAAGIGGTIILLIIVACAVGMFLMTMLRGKQYDYLEEVSIDTEYGVSGMAKERRSRYSETHARLLITGVMLCVVAVIPLLFLQLSRYSNNTDMLPVIGVDILLIMVAVVVKLIVLTCVRKAGYDKLLEEGDYTRLDKKASRFDGIYWMIALAVYLIWSFTNMRWDITWIVWPAAGVLYAAFHEIMKAVYRSRG